MCTLQFISCALMLKVITYFYIKFELPSIFRNVSIQGREFSWEREDRDQISPRVFCGDGNDDFSSFVEMEMGSHSLTGNSQLPSLILKPNYSWTWLGGYFHSVRLGEKNGFWFHTYACHHHVASRVRTNEKEQGDFRWCWSVECYHGLQAKKSVCCESI